MDINNFVFQSGYELSHKIGFGSYSKVYKAIRLKDKLEVAIKMILLSDLNKKQLKNCLEEIHIMSKINHPHIIQYIDAFLFSSKKILFIVTEFLGGGDLSTYISTKKRSRSYFGECDLWMFCVQILKGLQELHRQKVIHRDLKPANLFLTKNFKTIKIGDLNSSKIVKDQNLFNSLIGTPNYMAPEVWMTKTYDFKCDMFSLGCVLFEMATLRPLFNESSIGKLCKRIQSGR